MLYVSRRSVRPRRRTMLPARQRRRGQQGRGWGKKPRMNGEPNSQPNLRKRLHHERLLWRIGHNMADVYC